MMGKQFEWLTIGWMVQSSFGNIHVFMNNLDNEAIFGVCPGNDLEKAFGVFFYFYRDFPITYTVTVDGVDVSDGTMFGGADGTVIYIGCYGFRGLYFE